jgi:competence protein ComEC
VTPDLRTTYLAAAAWAGALVGLTVDGWVLAAGLSLTLLAAGVARRSHGMLAGCLLVCVAVSGSAGVRVAATATSPVAGWAEQRVVVEAVLVVRSDPMTREGRFGDYVVTRAELRSVVGRGTTVTTAVPVLVISGTEWQDVELGSRLRTTARLAPASTAQHAAVLSASGEPMVLEEPSTVMQGAASVRAAVRRAAAGGPEEASALVPALVTGDDQRLSTELVDDFRTAGLTHLTAVSGTNLTLVLAFLLLLARWLRIRGRGLLLVGLLGVVGFVLMARPEPSVVRAAAMGTVALLGLGAGGRAAGVRALGAAALFLLVLDPWLALSPGFALSVLATAGILFVAPGFRDALARWMPRLLAEAIAVPLAAQLACTPVVAALSGQISLVAVAANLVAAPAVGPATVLGLTGGLVGLVVPPLGAALGWLACWCAQLIIVVAHRSADLPAAAVDWPTSPTGLVWLTMLSVVAVGLAPAVLRRRATTLAAALVLGLLLLVPMPSPGWPPDGWVMVMCDVGQGDALVLAAGAHEAVVVDAGPDPASVDRCLRRLGVERVSAVVLTHFHADHVDGLPGVLRDRSVGEVVVTGVREPVSGAAQVEAWAAAARVPVRVPAYGEVAAVGAVSWQVRAPRRKPAGNANDASVVLMVESAGLRLLLTGDVEPPAQAGLVRESLGVVDVLKVPHHGSRYQDLGLLEDLQARVALVSVGEGNDYGHPDPGVLDRLKDSGAVVHRTDEDGDVAVLVRDGQLRVLTQR